MRKTILSLFAATLLAGTIAVAPARAEVDVHINIGPPGVLFHSEPDIVVVPRTQVYYAPAGDWDVYRYGSWWYANREGHWYRARSYRGPFAPVIYSHVPRQILVVPPKYHRHSFRPVRYKEHRRWKHNDRWDHDHDRGRGRGHGHGHGKGHHKHH